MTGLPRRVCIPPRSSSTTAHSAVHKIRFETGRLARLAAGSAVVYLDDETMVLSATTASKHPKEGLDFFPLTVDVEERMYAVGRIPGSFFRREGRPSEDAILTCRLIDRPLRPSFTARAAQRGPDRRDDHGPASRASLRRGRDQRGLAVHPAVRPAVLRADRRRPGRPDQGPVGRLPDLLAAGGRHVRHGGGRPGARGRRRRDHDGRGRVHRRARCACSPTPAAAPWRRPRTRWPPGWRRPSRSSRPCARASSRWRPHAAKEVAELPGLRRLPAGRLRRAGRRGLRRPGQGAHDRGQAGPGGRDRPGQGTGDRAAGRPVRGPREGDQRRVPVADQEAGPGADHPRRRADRRPRPGRHPAAVRRGRRAARGCTARRCSSAARPRSWASPR